MTDYTKFWTVPEFWVLVTVLLVVAAVMALSICCGPTEAPFEEDQDALDAADLVVKTEWGISLNEWAALTDDGRAYYRQNVAQAKAGDRG